MKSRPNPSRGHRKNKLNKRNELKEAQNGPEREQWVAALKKELDSILHTTTSIVAETPDPSKPYQVVYALRSTLYATTVLKKEGFFNSKPSLYLRVSEKWTLNYKF